MTDEEHKAFKDIAFFYYALIGRTDLQEIPISQLEELDIDLLQRLSKAANHEGVTLLLGVDPKDKSLIVASFGLDHQHKPLEPFSDTPDTAIYISNEADPEHVMKILLEMSDRYESLDPPAFQKYAQDDDTVPMDEFLEGNARVKYEHEIFMRDHGMHQTVIPLRYKKPTKLKLIK